MGGSRCHGAGAAGRSQPYRDANWIIIDCALCDGASGGGIRADLAQAVPEGNLLPLSGPDATTPTDAPASPIAVVNENTAAADSAAAPSSATAEPAASTTAEPAEPADAGDPTAPQTRRRRRQMPRLVLAILTWFQFTIVAFLLLFSFVMPRWLLRWLGAGFFSVLYRLDRRHRVVVKQNLIAAFGEATAPAQIERWARDTYRFFGMNLFEILWLWRQKDRTLLQFIHWHGLEHVFEATAHNKGIIFGTSHYGFWEIQTFAMRPYNDRLAAVMRPLDNPLVNRLVVHVRQASSAILFEKKGALLGVMRSLKLGYYSGLLIDQDGGRHGISVPFFGKPVQMMDAVGHIAYKTKSPIVMIMPVRNRKNLNNIDIMCSEVIYPDFALERNAAARKMIESCNQFLESVIRQYPEEYFWLHRRWKHGSPEVYQRQVE